MFYEPSIFDDQISILEQFEALKQYVIGFDPGGGGGTQEILDVTNYEFNLTNIIPDNTPRLIGNLITNYVNGSFTKAPFEFPFAITGSETIVVDVDENNKAVEIHLDADIVSKIQRMLVSPLNPPSAISLVAIDTNGNQIFLTLGEGLEIKNNVIVATGGGGEEDEDDELVTTVNIAGSLLTTTSPNPVLCYSAEDQKLYFAGEEEYGLSEWWMYVPSNLKPLFNAPNPTQSNVALTAGETYYYTYCTSDPNFAILVIQNGVKTWVTDMAGYVPVTWNSEQSLTMNNTEFTTSGSFIGISATNDPDDLYIGYGTNTEIGMGVPDYFVYYLMESGSAEEYHTIVNLYAFDGSLIDTYESGNSSPEISWGGGSNGYNILNIGPEQYISSSNMVGLAAEPNSKTLVINAGDNITLVPNQTYSYYVVTEEDIEEIPVTTVNLWAPTGSATSLTLKTYTIQSKTPYIQVNDGFGVGSGVTLSSDVNVTTNDLVYTNAYKSALGLATSHLGSITIGLNSPRLLEPGSTYTYYLRYDGDVPKTTTLNLYVPTSYTTWEKKVFTTTVAAPIIYVDNNNGLGGRVYFGDYDDLVYSTINYPVAGLSTTQTGTISPKVGEGWGGMVAGGTYTYYVRL